VNDDEVVEVVRAVAVTGTLPPPATLEAVADAEQIIGFPLPPLLRRLYLEVANGGFGPRDGILGVRGGACHGNFEDIADLYQDGPDPSGRIPAGLVLIYDWGCTIWSMVDFRDPAGAMWCNHEGEHWSQGINLAQWLTGTMSGTLDTQRMLDSQPPSPIN
jgi:hypothetical protein